MQGDPPARRDPCDLPEPAPPAAARARSGCRSRVGRRSRSKDEPFPGRSRLVAQQRPARRGGGRRRVRKNIPVGVAHIKSSFNNTIVTLTDREGNVIAWESAGGAGFKAPPKPPPFQPKVTPISPPARGTSKAFQKFGGLGKGPAPGARPRAGP